jgi:WD40 repeat protein
MKITAPYPGLRPFERHEDILFFGRDDQIDQLLDKLADTHFLAVLGTSGSGKSSLVKAGLLPALNSGYMAGAGARWEVAELRPGDRPFHRLADSLIRDTDWGKAYSLECCQESQLTTVDHPVKPGDDKEVCADEALLIKAEVRPDKDETRPIKAEAQLTKDDTRPDRDEAASAKAEAQLDRAEARPAKAVIARPDRAIQAVITRPDRVIHEDCAAEAGTALETNLRQGNMALNWRLGMQPLASGTRLLILIDQFEELFRYRRDAEADAAAFTALLLGAATRPDVYVVITMRSEFLGDCSLYPDLPEAINEGLFLTPSLTPEQMADAIQLPARLAPFNGEVDDELVKKLVREAEGSRDQLSLIELSTKDTKSTKIKKGHKDQLPLLQHVLMRLWDQADADPENQDKHLSPEGLKELGGLDACLNDHVEEAYNELTEKQKGIAEIMFRALTERSEEKRDTRRPASLGKIAQLADVSPAELTAVVEVFRQPGRSFLMPPVKKLETRNKKQDRENFHISKKLETGDKKQENENSHISDLNANTVLDITHEALIRQWKRLQKWTEDEAEQAELYLRLEGAAQRHQEEKGELWGGVDLEYALKWRKKNNPNKTWALRYEGDFNLAMSFLDAGKKARDDKREAEERERRKKLRRATWITVASVTALIITIALAVWALSERDNAVKAEIKAIKVEQVRTESLFDSSLTHASLLARVNDPAEAREVLSQTVKLDKSINESRQHTRNLLAGYVEIMGGTADKVYEGAGAALIDVAVSPDGRLLAAAGERGTLVLFDAKSGELLKRLEGHDVSAGGLNEVDAVVFTSKSDILYSGGVDRRIICWSMPDGEKLKEWEAPAAVWAMALSPDGKTLASAGQGDAITIWETSTSKRIRTLSGKTSSIAHGNSLAFSSDGQWLVSGGYEGSVGIWDINKEKEQVLPKIHTERVNSVAVSPDGKWIASGSADKRIILWDAKSGRPLRMLRGHENKVLGLTFRQDSRRLFSASHDNTMRLWDVATGVALRIYQGHTAGLWTVARHEETLYTAANDGTVRRWSADTPGQWVWDIEDEPVSTAVSPDGAFVSVGFADGGLRIYSLPNFKVVKMENQLLQPKLISEVTDAHGFGGGIRRLTFSPDGTLIATAGADNKAKLWRLKRNADGMSLNLLHTLKRHTATVHAVAFSPDGRTLATAGYDGKVGLFDVESGESRMFNSATVGQVLAAEFSTDGKQVMTVNRDDQIIRFWDIDSDLKEPALELPKMMDLPMWATLRPDSRQIAAVGREHVIKLYDLDPNTGLSTGTHRTLVGHEQTVFRAIYSPDGSQLATVSADMTLRLWDLTANKALFTLQLPTEFRHPTPLWDFDFRCTPDGHCWIAVPLTMGRLALYRIPYAKAPGSILERNGEEELGL